MKKNVQFEATNNQPIFSYDFSLENYKREKLYPKLYTSRVRIVPSQEHNSAI